MKKKENVWERNWSAIVAEIIPKLEELRVSKPVIAEFRKHLSRFEAGEPLRE